MSKPWGGIGSWAAEAEAEERELAAAAAAAPTTIKASADLQSFPSLKDAVSSKPKKKKTIPLSEFMTGGRIGVSSQTGLTPAEMLQLPTGPQQRSSDDYPGSRLGGGFSNYGRSSGGSSGRREGDSDSSWGAGRRSYGGFDEDRRRGPDYDVQPSRADEADNWAAGKKAMPPPSMDSGRTNRYGTLGGGSRADDADSWSFGKKPMTVAPPPARSSTFGSGYRDSGFDSDRWKRGGEERERVGPSDRPKLVLDPPSGHAAGTESPQVPAKTNKPNPFGAARPREEILAEKGVDWKKADLDMDSKKSVSSRPTSSQGSRPSSAQSSRSESLGLPGPSMSADVVVKPRPRVNPFGDAKPREVVLQEKGKDWRKIDLELERRAIDRPETEEEKALKEEIDSLKKEIDKELPSDPSQVSGADQTSVQDLIQLKEKELEVLVRELDDKIRFTQKPAERPGSGAGRFGSFLDRPPSQSGSVDDARSTDFADRPRSRGTADIWTRPGDDRRGSFHGVRDRGFRGGRDFDRPVSRERW